MKRIITIIFVLIFLSLPQAQTSAGKVELTTNNYLPDVNNRINVVKTISDKLVRETILLDTFPNFSGFPKQMSGFSVEGGIMVNMDSDPELEVLYNIGNKVYAWNSDGTDVAGWPKSVSPTMQSAPAFGDIDGDGEGEIVVTRFSGTSNGTLYAFEKDGSDVTGFPITHGYSTRSPVLADLDGDGALEIIINKRLYPDGEVWVYKGDGTVFPGWPQTIIGVPASSAAAGDITGDGVPEVIFESYTRLYAWDKDGNLLTGFPFELPAGSTHSYSSPVLADVDNDNVREIIFGTHNINNGTGSVYILKNDGSILTGWPKSTNWWVYSPPAVGYIDEDNIIDIAVGDQVLSGTPTNYVYVWNANGDPLPGFPVGPVNAINAQIILADIDNDNLIELITDDNATPALYHAYNHDGSVVTGWPIELSGQTTFFQTPALGDVNKDNILDMLCASTDAATYVSVNLLNTGISFYPDKIELSCFQYNERHNGVYGDLAIALPVELVSFSASVTDKGVELKWVTASELNNLGFEIQRSSDGKSFVTIGFVEGNGTTTEENNYSYTDEGVKNGIYHYRLKQVDFLGAFEYSDIIEIDVNLAPTEFALYQNYPNPFNPSTKIKFNIPSPYLREEQRVRLTTLKVYDVLGNEVATLINKKLQPGTYEVEFDATNLPSGIYFYQLSSGKFEQTNKMILLR